MTELESIATAWAKHIENLKPAHSGNARDYFYAGGWRPCLRRMVLEATHPEFLPDYDTEAKARFLRGDQREIDLRQALERVGQLCMPSFTVEGAQEHIWLTDLKGRKVISGKKDCSIRWESRARWSTEFKSWSVFLTDKIFTFEDLLRSPYTQSGARQLLAYLYAKNEPYGLLVLDRPGLPRLIQVNLEDHLDLMQGFLSDAEAGRNHIEAGTLPDYIQDPAECKRCPLFGSHCNPPLSFAGASIVTDEETIARTERYADLQSMPEIEEFEALDKWAKERFRGIEQAIVGKCVVGGHWQKDTKYELTDEAKKQIQAIKKPFAQKLEKGKFFLTVAKVTE